jgi:hypothetical protein
METTYIAICLGYWGRGETEAAAMAQCRKAGGRKKDKTLIHKIVSEAGKDRPFVDGNGSINYFGTRELVAEYVNGKRIEKTA